MAKFTAMCSKVRLSVTRNGIFQPLAARMGVITTRMFSSAEGNGGNIIDPVDTTPPIPEYVMKSGETIDLKRSRLLYQSRKRGMLENGLLLSNFAGRHLDSLTPEQLATYDKLINLPTNDWEIYYWMTGVKETPEEYQSDVMDLLQEFVKNEDREVRIRQPDLA